MDEDMLQREAADDKLISEAYDKLIGDYLNSRHRAWHYQAVGY